MDKTAQPLIQWFCHRAWEQVAESRWTKSVNLLRRVLTGCLAQRILPNCLRGMQTSWQVHEGLAAALERQVRADANDFTSRNKLRLLRVCRALCPPDAAPDVAIVLQALLAVDPVLYDLLGGDHTDTVQVTLADFCCWERNPISVAQDRIVKRLQAWGTEGPIWSVLAGVGARFDDPRCALLAKAELLAMSAGLVDHFELRMVAPPYSLIRLLSPGVSPGVQRRCVESFLQTPEHCLTDFCKRLRARCPTIAAVLRQGRPIIEAWAKGSFLGIGRTEQRSHGLMRQELRSERRARSFTRSANRSLCQELRSTHMKRGGTDPAKPAPLTSSQGGGVGEGDPPSKKQKDRGLVRRKLSPYLVFLNFELHHCKAQIAPDRPMTAAERQRVDDRCSAEWRAMTEDAKQAWRLRGEGDNLAGILAQHANDQPLAPLPEQQSFEPWAGCGCSTRPLPIEAVADEISSLATADRAKVAFSDPKLAVMGAPPRASTLPPGKEVQRGMWGCFATKLVCRETIAPSLAAALDTMTRNMQSWVDSLGAEVVRKSESLVCFRGTHPVTHRRKYLVALLLFSRKQPSIHFYARCDIIKGASPSAALATMPEALPCVASIRVVRSRLSSKWASIDIKTSEELAYEMVLSRMEWAIVPLQWRLPDGASPLLDHVVTKLDGAFEPKQKIARDKVVTADDDVLDQLLTDSDPIAAGLRVAREAKAKAAAWGAAPQLQGAPPFHSIPIDDDEAGMEEEAELFADMEVDPLDDLQQEFFGEPMELGEIGEALGEVEDILDGQEVDEPVGEGAAPSLAAGAPPEAPEEGAPPRGTPILVDGVLFHKGCLGYISCRDPPMGLQTQHRPHHHMGQICEGGEP